MEIFQDLNGRGITIILVTHERDIARYATRVIEMRDGVIVGDTPMRDRRDAGSDVAAFRHGGGGGKAVRP